MGKSDFTPKSIKTSPQNKKITVISKKNIKNLKQRMTEMNGKKLNSS